jgi:hypothetical protein
MNLIACSLRVADVHKVQRKWIIAERTKSCHKKEPKQRDARVFAVLPQLEGSWRLGGRGVGGWW